MADSILKTKSYHFAIRIVRLAQMLQSDRMEFVLIPAIWKRVFPFP